MSLPLRRPFAPMEALSVDEIPQGEDWQYEPKWDGFRCLVFRDGGKVELQSKAGQPLTRYFPQLVEAVGALTAKRFVLDGEIVVPRGKAFSFDDLLQRIHPAASRVKKLSAETPALLIVFDMLVDGDELLTKEPLPARRKRLEAFAKKNLRGQKTIRLSPATSKLADAQKWLKQVGATLDGIIAKRRDLPYQSGNRHSMLKIKNYRSADCVVGGFRYNEGTVGSLLLGALWRGRPARPRRLHLLDPCRPQEGAHREARKADRAARLHRQQAGRAEPLVDQALERVAAP